MKEFEYPESPLHSYHHDHPKIENINEQVLKPSQRIADKVAAVIGGWPFIIVQSILLVLWIVLNVYLAVHQSAVKAFDP